jgi:hypothetical protein
MNFRSTVGLVFLFGLGSVVHAASLVYTAEYSYENNSNLTVSVEALFDTGLLAGSGSEAVALDALALRFYSYGVLRHTGVQHADIVPAVPGDPWYDGQLLALFEDGVFDTLDSYDAGGSSRIAISPPSNWLGEGINIGRNRLTDFPCCSGFNRYWLTSELLVPLPPAVWLFGTGLLYLSRFCGRRAFGQSSRRLAV